MVEEYSSVLNYFGTDFQCEWINPVLEEIEQYSVEQLIQLKNSVEEKLAEHRANEPSGKQSKREYKSWVQKTHDYLDFLRIIREKIIEKNT